nr:hypothetical protein [Tanacetum cinerariifolium]
PGCLGLAGKGSGGDGE